MEMTVCDLATAQAREAELIAEIHRLMTAIRRHRDYKGDDRCWLDDEELYSALPEGFTPPARGSRVELLNCERYIQCRHNPATEYVSPQREIERLTKERDALAAFKKWVHDWLDAVGVPHDPEPEHTKEHGCRISGRMRWLLNNKSSK